MAWLDIWCLIQVSVEMRARASFLLHWSRHRPDRSHGDPQYDRYLARSALPLVTSAWAATPRSAGESFKGRALSTRAPLCSRAQVSEALYHTAHIMSTR